MARENLRNQMTLTDIASLHNGRTCYIFKQVKFVIKLNNALQLVESRWFVKQPCYEHYNSF